MKETIERLRDLFSQMTEIENEIENLIGGGRPKRTYKKRGTKPKPDHPWLGKRRGRPPKQRNDFLCLKCARPFTSNLGELDAKCPYCGSLEFERGVRDGEVREDN